MKISGAKFLRHNKTDQHKKNERKTIKDENTMKVLKFCNLESIFLNVTIALSDLLLWKSLTAVRIGLSLLRSNWREDRLAAFALFFIEFDFPRGLS